jgi:hypothetical protein
MLHDKLKGQHEACHLFEMALYRASARCARSASAACLCNRWKLSRARVNSSWSRSFCSFSRGSRPCNRKWYSANWLLSTTLRNLYRDADLPPPPPKKKYKLLNAQHFHPGSGLFLMDSFYYSVRVFINSYI